MSTEYTIGEAAAQRHALVARRAEVDGMPLQPKKNWNSWLKRHFVWI